MAYGLLTIIAMRINKLTASIGTEVVVDNPDVTAWLLCGWTTVYQYDIGRVLLRKVKE